jgi:hypothetical protein
MKRLLFICLALMLMSFNEVVTAVVAAFEKADANKISSYFDSSIGIKPPGELEFRIQPKQQAASWLNTFYVEKNITGFEQVSINDIDGHTVIQGRLLNGQRKYAVTIRINKVGDDYKIASIKF